MLEEDFECLAWQNAVGEDLSSSLNQILSAVSICNTSCIAVGLSEVAASYSFARTSAFEAATDAIHSIHPLD